MAKSKKRTVHPVLATFGKNLRSARLDRGLTQAALAREAGISVAYVSLLERAGRNPPLRQVAELASVLGTTTAALVTEAAA